MKKLLLSAVILGGFVSLIGFKTVAYGQTATPTPTTATVTITPTPTTSVTVPSGAPKTGFASN